MIQAIFNYQGDFINEVTITGHAEHSKNVKNHDLVCAAVSGISFGILNSLTSTLNQIVIKENFIMIKVLKNEQENNLILKILLNSLKSVTNDYPKNVKLIIRGVKNEQL